MRRMLLIAATVIALGVLTVASPASGAINCDFGDVVFCHGGEGSGGGGSGSGVGVLLKFNPTTGEFFDAGGSGLGGSGEGGGGGQHCSGIIPPPEALDCHGGVSR